MYNQNKDEFHRRLAVLGGVSGLGGKTYAEGSSSSMDVEITTGTPLVESTVVDLACAPSIPTPTPAAKKEAAALKKKEKAAEKAAEKASKKKGTTKATAGASATASASLNCVSTLTNSSGKNHISATFNLFIWIFVYLFSCMKYMYTYLCRYVTIDIYLS